LPPKASTQSTLTSGMAKRDEAFDALMSISTSISGVFPNNEAEFQKNLKTLMNLDSPVASVVEKLWSTLEGEDIGKLVSDLHSRKKSNPYFKMEMKYAILKLLTSHDNLSQFSSDEILGLFIQGIIHTIKNGQLDSVYDPAFGAGTVVFSTFDDPNSPSLDMYVDEVGNEEEFLRFTTKKIVGMEINSEIANLAKSTGNIFNFDTDIKIGDGLELMPGKAELHDLVLCEPPAGQRLEEKYFRQEWPYGRPGRSSADWAWAQIVQRHVREGGLGLLFVTAGALFRKNPNDILVRAKMVNAGVVRAVINLPEGFALAHRANMAMIIFGSPRRNENNQKQILFVDMREPKGKKGSYEYVVGLHKQIYDVCDIYTDFENGYFDKEIGYTASLSINDPQLMKNDMNLNPSLYVSEVVTGVNQKLTLKKNVTQISKTVKDLTNLMEIAEKELASFTVQAEFVNFGDLFTTEKIQQVTGLSKNEFKSNEIPGLKYNADSGERIDSGDKRDSQISYISVEDIRRPGKLLQTGVLRPDVIKEQNELVYTKPGDVVYIKTGKPAAKVDYEGGKALFSPLSVLRITEDGKKTISPEILAFVLNGEKVKKFMQGSTVGRLKIESVPVPIMDSVNIKEIDQKIDLIHKVLMRAIELNQGLTALELKLNQVLAGEFDGLQEDR